MTLRGGLPLQSSMEGMIAHLASLAEKKVIISFAPKTLAYSILKRIGELFPGPSQVCGLGLDPDSMGMAAYLVPEHWARPWG